MLSKNTLKYIRSLKEKKYRQRHGVFVAEGDKLIEELLYHIPCRMLIVTGESCLPAILDADANILPPEETWEVSHSELKKASFLQHPQHSLAVFSLPSHLLEQVNPQEQLLLVLDGIQDPGNLGTIVRLANWFGIQHIVCSADTADIFNPKAMQASMGAVARVNVHYTDLGSWLKTHEHRTSIFAACLSGENLYEMELPPSGVIIMGNEGQGIRPYLNRYITHRVHIPTFPVGNQRVESLNVAVATAIICSEFRRRH